MLILPSSSEFAARGLAVSRGKATSLPLEPASPLAVPRTLCLSSFSRISRVSLFLTFRVQAHFSSISWIMALH